jgi:hypothetical protein
MVLNGKTVIAARFELVDRAEAAATTTEAAARRPSPRG